MESVSRDNVQREIQVNFRNLNGEHFTRLNAVLEVQAAGTVIQYFILRLSRSNISDAFVTLTVMDDANIAANDPEPQHRSFLPSTLPPKWN